MIQLQTLTKQYPDGTFAIDDISLEIQEGEFCVLLGPSGAGKSTLLKLLNGMVTPSKGSITINGKTLLPKALKEIRSIISTIHQNFNLVTRMSVEKNVLAGALSKVSLLRALFGVFPQPLRRKACDLIASVGLEEKHLYRRVVELSGGQQQRVGIARAFILDPSIVLADEPVASLDPNISRNVLSILRNAAQRNNTTVLCSLHQVDLAKEFGERIIGVNKGKIVFDGTPELLTQQDLEKIYA